MLKFAWIVDDKNMENWLSKHWWKVLIVIAIFIVFIWQMPWIDIHQGSLMVLITFVYVIATIAIFVANNNTVKASNAQLEESRRQFEEDKRLQYAPFLQMEMLKLNPTAVDEVFEIPGVGANKKAYFSVKNIGNGTACNISLYATSEFFENVGSCLNCNAIMQGDKISLRISYKENKSVNGIMTITWTYNDIIDNTYEQKIYIQFEKSSIVKCEVDYPRFQGIVRYSLKAEDVGDPQ